MKTEKFKKSLSLFLAVFMLLTMMPFADIIPKADAAYPVMKSFNAASGDDFHRYYKQVYTVTFLDEIDTAARDNALEKWDMSADGDGSVWGWMYLNDEATAAAGDNRYDVYVAAEGGVAAHENTTHMFYVFSSLKEVKGMENFHTGNVKSFLYWFGNCFELENIDLSKLDTTSATTFKQMFYGCYMLREIDASSWNTSNVTSLESMFYRCYALERANLSGWDTSKVTSMKGLFEMTPPSSVSPDYSLKSVDLSGWNTSNVTTMENMFKNCEALTELDLSSFDTSKVTTMRFMFYYCKQLKNIYVGEGWTTEAIKNINDGVFNCCYALIGQTDDQVKNEEIYIDKHPSAYYPPSVEYAKLREDDGYLDNIANKPQKPKYTVTYKFTGDIIPDGVSVIDPAIYEEGTTVTVADDASAEHYIFSGWSTEDATVDADGNFIINNDVEFVGSWIKLYRVEYKYDENYELPAEAPQIPDTELWFAPGEDVPVYGIPYVYEYVFVGWNTEDAEVVGDSFIMPENDVVLYGFYKIPVESVEIMGGDITVDIDETTKINVYVKPEDATIPEITYESSDETVVRVDENGNITPVGEGTATITVTSVDDPTKTDTVTVTVKIPVTDITVDKTEISLNKGETDKITVTEVKPVEATNKEVTYESSDETVVKVDENGNIVAVGEGTATITVTSKDNKDVKEEIPVTVKIPVTELTVTDDFTLNVGEEKNVDAKVNEDATNKELIYESSNPGVVKIDSDGNVVAVGEGTATITVTSKEDPSITETVTVTVKIPVVDIEVEREDITLPEGDSDKITVTVIPNEATNKGVTFESDNENVIKVDEEGNIEAVGEGTATVTITSKDDESITETVTVTVIKKTYKVTYEFTGDVIPENVEAPEMKKYVDGSNVTVEADAAADGYIFSGWSTEDASVENGEFKITNDVHFVGSWSKLYNVTYEYVGEVPADATELPAKESYTAGTAVDVKADATAEGYTFSGWTTDDADVTDGGFTMPAKDVVLKGSFEKIINYYDVTYKYEGEVPADAPAVPGKETYEEGSNVAVENVPSLDGYTFIGWETKDVTVTDGKFTVNNDVEFVGKWEKIINYYDVTYKYEGEVPADAPAVPGKETYEEGSNVAVENVPSLDGYTFIGWETKDVTVTDGKFTVNNDVEFVGKWEKKIIPVEKVEVEKDEFTLTEGDKDKIEVTVTPDDATNKKVTYESSDESIVKVDENGNIEAVGEGEATITVTTEDGKKQVTVTVKVEKKDEPEQPDIPDVPEEPEYTIEVIDKLEIKQGVTELIYVKVTPNDGSLRPTFSSADESIAKVDEFGNVTGVSAGTTTIYVSFPNGEVRAVIVTVPAPIVPGIPSIPKTHHVCFGKTDGIGWYEVSVNGGDFFPQGPNSTLEVAEGSILVVRVQDMWIDDEFDFYVNGEKVPLDPANTITVVVDGYMLIGALSMDVPVPDVEESLTLFQRIIRAIKAFFQWIAGWFK